MRSWSISGRLFPIWILHITLHHKCLIARWYVIDLSKRHCTTTFLHYYICSRTAQGNRVIANEQCVKPPTLYVSPLLEPIGNSCFRLLGNQYLSIDCQYCYLLTRKTESDAKETRVASRCSCLLCAQSVHYTMNHVLWSFIVFVDVSSWRCSNNWSNVELGNEVKKIGQIKTINKYNHKMEESDNEEVNPVIILNPW